MSCDDQLQSKNLKVIGIWPTNLEVIDVEVFSEIWGKPKEKLQKFLAERKKRLESLAQVYIDDIHVMNVFFVWSHNEILGYLYHIGWYEVSYKTTQYKNTMA